MALKRRSFLAVSMTGMGGIMLNSTLTAQGSDGAHPGPDGNNRKVFVIGGPGNIGTSTLEVLAEKGYQVGLFTLKESYSEEWAKKLKFFLGDRHNKDELKKAFDEFQPDYVVDFVLYEPPDADAILDIVYGKVKQYLYVSTVDVIGYPTATVPARERVPVTKVRTEYAQKKLDMERLFLSKLEKEKFPLTIARPTYSMGARMVIGLVDPNNGGLKLMQRIRADKPILVPGDGTTLMTVSNAKNTGRVIARLVGEEKAMGKIYHAGQEDIMTHDDYARRIAKVMGKEPKLVHVPSDLIVEKGGKEAQGCLLTFLTGYNLAFSLETFRTDFPDFKVRETMEDGIRDYIAANEKNGRLNQPIEESFDDRVIAAWGKCKEHFVM